MQISFRSHLIAGTAAVVGAAAVLAPVAQDRPALPALKAPVALAAFANPFTELLATAELAQTYIFANYYNGGDSPTPGAGEANWPYAGMSQTGGELLNYALYNNAALGYYYAVGEIPQNIADAAPVQRQLESNIAGYINAGLSGLIGVGYALTDGLWSFPSALVAAAQLALAGQFSAALSTLTAAVIAPIQTAAQSVVTAGTYIVSNIAARLGAVVQALPQIATTFAGAAAGTAVLTAQAVTATTNAVISNLLALNFEGAWNAAVGGFLGPAGVPGVALNLLTGAGIQTGPILNPATDIPTNFVPSIRTATQAAVWTLQGALSTTAPSPVAAVPARSAARSVAAKPAAAKSAKAPRAARSAK